ncbi:GntR family transcriptional regulator [Rhodococcus spongiicola]|uniref:GntR family transcriptional regulator n=1 Tax=Rhodococcus spongiicola TaxID=2487352 RepID=A0A3S3ARE7_9NOCA|nr:GntR family transcriptional regulator [Rhodococcus spongiicola]RVW06683.1 GntR family transcriptional regulator [Rhodococcus spongiicola]
MSKLHSAAEVAYRQVKELILSGELPGGELISEGEIATRMGCSRTPVREAFLRLEAEGWMRLYPKRGALVVPIAEGEAEHVVDARLLLEVHAVEAVVADRRTREELVATLRTNLSQQRELVASTCDAARFSVLDADFHRALVRAGGNPLLDAFYDGLRERQRRMMAHSLARDPEQITKVIEDHTRLADLIEAADAEGFASAVRRHMREVHALRMGGRR